MKRQSVHIASRQKKLNLLRIHHRIIVREKWKSRLDIGLCYWIGKKVQVMPAVESLQVAVPVQGFACIVALPPHCRKHHC